MVHRCQGFPGSIKVCVQDFLYWGDREESFPNQLKIAYNFIILLNTQVMIILILIDVQYSQKAVFSFDKGLNGQNHSSTGSHQPVKKSPSKIPDSPHCSLPLTAIWKTLVEGGRVRISLPPSGGKQKFCSGDFIGSWEPGEG